VEIRSRRNRKLDVVFARNIATGAFSTPEVALENEMAVANWSYVRAGRETEQVLRVDSVLVAVAGRMSVRSSGMLVFMRVPRTGWGGVRVGPRAGAVRMRSVVGARRTMLVPMRVSFSAG
jgi:hypothetical protein